MARPRQRAQVRHQYNRTDRISQSVREIVATELERLGDERLEMVTITDVVIDNELARAMVYYSALTAAADDRLDEVPDALEEIRWRIQKVVNREITARRTPQIQFEPDEVLAAALRIDDILAQQQPPASSEQD
jgi:ribosome-binding factor A